MREEREKIRDFAFEAAGSGQVYGSIRVRPRGEHPRNAQEPGRCDEPGPAPFVRSRWTYQIASTHSGWSMKGLRLPW
ncbi:hypothetical protein GCM10017674_15620 [Streptomyces gardneri]|uniref:Uncharacterized protein n=1 Tax=Streptomyces gardneri TaxID=66892 RepID=A0A4Y3RA95_9ACTN|nr:hypothetical protein SGA01_02560 [Streptomyces gardneri]GHG89072.1 hypothetical protein GCM10017674_15620 [Streptomyces gardneri]